MSGRFMGIEKDSAAGELKWRLDLPVGRIAAIAGGRVLRGDAGRVVGPLTHDTRTPVAGALFVAIRGENFDGHSFVAEAARQGAAGALVGESLDAHVSLTDLPEDFAVVRVDDTVEALGRLGAERRARANIPVIAVAGSSGKTTTKDMIAHVLEGRLRVHKTPGNFNNLIGLPLTLFALREAHEALVVEVGMNQPGELARLTRMASPTLGVLTNVGVAHIGMFGGEEGLMAAKGEFVENLPVTARLIYSADCERSARVVGPRIAKRETVRVGERGGAEARIVNVTSWGMGHEFGLDFAGKIATLRLPIFGRHNVWNAAMAAVAGLDLGLDIAGIAGRLATFAARAMRSEVFAIGGARLIADCYNANPDSVCAALASLAEMGDGRGRRVAVLGDMFELGEAAEAQHARVGRRVAELGLERLVTVGELSRTVAEAARKGGVETRVCATPGEAAQAVLEELQAGDIVLVKGSRRMKLEEVVAILRDFGK